MKTTFTLLTFDELSKRELYDMLHLRDVVFVVGQKVTAVPEVDGEDPKCSHVLGWHEDRLVATSRLFMSESPIVVGRVAVHPDFQGRGIGREMMAYVRDFLGDKPSELHAQAHLESWYADLGWTRVGDIFDEADIPHVMMVRGPLA